MALGYVLAILASALWGLNYALDQQVLAGIPVIKLYFLHCVFGACVTLLLWPATNRPYTEIASLSSLPISTRLLLVTLVVGTAASLSIFGSIQILSAARASLLEISYPLFVALFSYLFFQQPISISVAIGGAFVFLGSAIIIYWS